MNVIDTRQPKLCFAKPGDVIQIDDKQFMVCVVPAEKKRAARVEATNGLYDDERPLFLVNVSTGVAVAMPHLSSRVEILHDAVLNLGV